MDHRYLLYFAGICGIIFFLSLVRNKKEAFVTFLMRALMGVLGIYFLNKLWLHYGIEVDGKILRAGLNSWNIGICGVLGFPGLLLIYAVLFFG